MVYIDQFMTTKIPKSQVRLSSKENDKGINLLFITDNAPFYNFLETQRADLYGDIFTPNLFGTILGKKIVSTYYYKAFRNAQPRFKVQKNLKIQDTKKTQVFDMSHFSNDFIELINSQSQKLVTDKLFSSFNSIIKDFKKTSSGKNFLAVYCDVNQNVSGSHFSEVFEYMSQLNANKLKTDLDGIFYIVDKYYYPIAIKDEKSKKPELTFLKNNIKLVQKIIDGMIDKNIGAISNVDQIEDILEDKTTEIKSNQIRQDIIDLSKTLNDSGTPGTSKNKQGSTSIKNMMTEEESDLKTIDDIKAKVAEYKTLHGTNISFEETLKEIFNKPIKKEDQKTKDKNLKDISKISESDKEIQKQYAGQINLILSTREKQNRVFNSNNITGLTEANGYDRQRTEFKDHIDNELKEMFMHFEADPKLNLKVLDFKASNIIDDDRNRYKEYSIKVQHKNFGKTKSSPYTIKFKVPVPQNDKYFKLNGQQYILINQIYPKPIIKVNQHLARLHTMHTNTAAFEIKKSKLDNEDYKYLEKDFIAELLKDKNTKIQEFDNDIKDRTIEKYNLPLDFINFQYSIIETKGTKDNPVRYKFDFTQDKFFEQYKGILNDKELVRYATYSKDSDDIIYYDQGDMKKYPKKKINEFIIKMYEDMSKELYKVSIINKNKSAKPHYTFRLLKSNIPSIMVLINWIGFKSTAKKLGIKYTIGKKSNFSIKLKGSKDYLNMYPEGLKQEFFVNGLLIGKLQLDKNLINSDSTEVLDEYFNSWIGTTRTIQLHELKDKIIDKITSRVLTELQYSNDIIDIVSDVLPDMLMTRDDKNHNDLDNYRIRMSETITHKLFEQMNQSIGYLKKRENTADAKLEIQPNFLNQYLSSTGIIQNTFSINPLEELNISMKTTKSGVGNSLKSQITLEKRDLNKTHFGTISPTATNEYGGIGLTQTLTNGHMIKDKFGNVQLKDFNNNDNPFKNLSAIESLTPFVDRNDTTRVVMGNQQSNQFLQLENPDESLVQTGFESFIPKLSSERFTKKAPMDGVVENIENNIVSIKDKNGKIHKINCNSVKARNKRGIYIPLDYSIGVKKGQKVKDRDILASSNSLKTGKLAVGKNLNVAIMGYLGANYEDGWAMSKSSASKYKAKMYKRLQMRIPEDAEIIDWNLEMKDTTNGDLLLSYKRNKLMDDTLDDFDVETDDDILIALESKDKISKFFSPGGKIRDIVIKINSTTSNILKAKHKERIKSLESITKECADIDNGSNKKGYSSEYYSCLGQYENSDQIQIGGHKLKGHEFQGALIEVYVEFDHEVMNGSKFTLGNTGAKGTVQYIIPEGQEPVATESGLKIDFIPTPVSIIGRKNPGILYSLYLGKVIYYMNKVAKQLVKEKKINQIKKLILEVYTHLDQTPDKVINKDLEMFFKTSNDNIIKTINDSDPLTKPAFPAIVQPFYNKITIKNIKAAANVIGIPLNETVTYTENGGIVSKKKVPVGILNVYLLEHIPKYMGSVRGSLNNKYQMMTGQGSSGTSEGAGASQIGLYDLYSLMTFQPYGLLKELHSLKSDNSKGRTQLNNELIHGEGYPDIEDIEVQEEDNVSKNLSKFLFLGGGLQPNY